MSLAYEAYGLRRLAKSPIIHGVPAIPAAATAHHHHHHHHHSPPSQWQQFFTRNSSNDLITRYTNSPSGSAWSGNIRSPSSGSHYDHNADSRQSPSATSSSTGHYPDSSSARTAIPSSPSSNPPFTSYLPMPKSHEPPRLPSSSSSTHQSPCEGWNSELYVIDDSDSQSDPSRPSTSSMSIKQEPEESEDGFINEFMVSGSYASASGGRSSSQCAIPPTEVPLRATQATKEMRKMMGVFRLNPFAMHHDGSGGRGAPSATPTWNGEEVGPLEEEPRIFEFQLGEEDLVEIGSSEGLRSFSPGFEIDNGVDAEWEKAGTSPRQAPPLPSSRSSTQTYPSPYMGVRSSSAELEYVDSFQDDHHHRESIHYEYSVENNYPDSTTQHRPSFQIPSSHHSHGSPSPSIEINRTGTSTTTTQHSRGTTSESSWSAAARQDDITSSSRMGYFNRHDSDNHTSLVRHNTHAHDHQQTYVSVMSNSCFGQSSTTNIASAGSYMQAGGTGGSGGGILSTSASRRWIMPVKQPQAPFLM